MISFTSRLLEFYLVNHREVVINIGCQLMDWLSKLRIVLKAERIAFVLDDPLLIPSAIDAFDED